MRAFPATETSPTIDPHDVLAQLSELADDPSTPEESARTARQWKDAIEATSTFLEKRSHPVVFIGSVGVGKSSLIGVLAELLVGSPPTDRATLKESSVLAIGSGRTTVCEIQIRASRPEEPGSVGLLIEPFSPKELEAEIAIYAQYEWTRRHQVAGSPIEGESEPTAQEIHRAIRGMAGYAEYQEVKLDGGLKRRRNVRPIDEVVANFSTHEELARHLLERINPEARIETAWWWDAPSPHQLQELKRRFEDLNGGREPSAMLPRRMTVVVPNPLPGSQLALDLTLIDTRGLDGKVESRRDLQEFLRDPRAVGVLCAPFKDAPGDTLRALLGSMANDVELRQAIPRTVLLLLDHGDAEQVNGAEGDREFGQELKLDECHVALNGAALSSAIEKSQLVAFDVLQDDRKRLLGAIDQRLLALRNARQSLLQERIRDATSFLSSRSERLSALRGEVDEQIRLTMAQHPLDGFPLTEPLAGLFNAIAATPFASMVYATCRRFGTYPSLHLYAAVRAEGSRAAGAWLSQLVDPVTGRLEKLLEEPGFEEIGSHIRLRRAQFDEGQLRVISDYATRLGNQVEQLLNDPNKPDPIWQSCCDEWGAGRGFKNRVLEHLRGWSSRQLGLTAHERTEVAGAIPFFAEVVWPVPITQFTLSVRNLRSLRNALWTPEPVSVLIGANGAGKTTLLQTLKLLRIAYERGLPEAVKIVLRGSANLKSWGAPESEPVQLTLNIGDSSWCIELVPREGSVGYLTNERFTDSGREIFSRDSLGGFVFGAERLEASPLVGLRVLMDRGERHPALLRMASFVQGIAVYQDPDLWTLREQGSSTTEDRLLDTRGGNALTLLRRWSQDRSHRHRYQFVLEGLRAAFPNAVGDLDFVEAGNTLAVRVYRPEVEQPSPLSSEANGLVQLLVLFCDIAAAEEGGLVAIDEPEGSLHPYALRTFLRRTTRWARDHHLTVLLATHSTVILDELSDHPEQVYAMKPAKEGEAIPTRLDKLCDPRWLEGFKLGDLYEQGEIGSNEDESLILRNL